MDKATDDLPEDFELSQEFSEIFALLEQSRDHFFVTGDAGTGKSTLLKYFRRYTAKSIVVLASTGVAAINVHGQTIHSFFKFPPRLIRPAEIHRLRNRKLFDALDAIVIDEISMVRADVIDGIDYALRLNKGTNVPFGGVQVIMFGDLAQLPPVVENDELKKFFKSMHGTHYFFDAVIFNIVKIKYVELTKIYRQKDEKFIDILNKVKAKKITDSELDYLNEQGSSRYYSDSDGVIVLTSTNYIAEELNQLRLDALATRSFYYEAIVDGLFDEREFPTAEKLRLKSGAQVMLLRNDVKKKRWVNGTIALISRLSESKVTIAVGDNFYDLEPEVWEKIQYSYDEQKKKIVETVIGTFTQLPLKLAWAITIHKSQGKTFDKVIIDLGYRAFTHGQVYVALSRCTCLKGVSLERPIRQSDIIFDDAARGFKQKFEKIEILENKLL
jgi:ATP-dependent exoDNAse (exonuclease V) alpha subunit